MLQNKKQNNKGLAGVAALIVFIALVLVAAIAATVILDVTGNLEQQASNTGQEAEGQLSSSVSVVEVTGQVDNTTTPETISGINITVSASPGADPIELNDTTIEITTRDSSATLVEANNGNAGADAGEFTVVELVSQNTNTNIIRRSQDRYRLDINMSQSPPLDSGNLAEDEEVELVINSGQGGSTFENFVVPSTLSSAEDTITL